MNTSDKAVPLSGKEDKPMCKLYLLFEFNQFSFLIINCDNGDNIFGNNCELIFYYHPTLNVIMQASLFVS